MAQNVFNLYSATIFAEHPLALWNLDDDFSYLSLINASPVWTITGGTSSSVEFEPPTFPSEQVGTGDINPVLESFSGSGSVLILEAQPYNSVSDTDQERFTACVSAYIYPYNSKISKYKIGVKYKLSSSASWTYDLNEYTISESEQGKWKKVSHTYDSYFETSFDPGNLPPGSIPPIITIEADIYPVLIVEFANDTTERKISTYNFAVGQWSEQFNLDSIGSIVTPLTGISSSQVFIDSLALTLTERAALSTYPIDPYGFSEADTGYYFTYNNRMLCRNTKLPMVFGSGNITEIYDNPSAGLPSLAVPGKGFLHNNGKYKELTAEFWLRINPRNTLEKKIFGPIVGNDGLYVDNNFITLKVGHKRKSHFIGKWYRPMLIDIRYNPLFVSVLINGDVVISFDITPVDTTLPDGNNDWLGFYSYNDIGNFEIDCIAVYPYIVSEQAAKRKFVYGQGVGKSEEITKRFNGISTGIDFSFAKYTNNLTYPDMTKWGAGFFSNINATSKYIGLPEYEIPEITFVGDNLQPFTIPRVRRTWKTLKDSLIPWDEWRAGVWAALGQTREANALVDNYDSQSESNGIYNAETGALPYYIRFNPNSLYDNLYGAISFKNMNPISSTVESVFGLFSIKRNELLDIQAESSYQLVLMHMMNRSNGDVFKIILDVSEMNDGNPPGEEFETSINPAKIQYIFNSTVLYEEEITINSSDTPFAVGFKIAKMKDLYGGIIGSFFATPQNIALNVGNYGFDQFTGKVFRVTFNNAFYTNKDMSSVFDNETAFINQISSFTDSLFYYVGNYTLLFNKANSSMVIDIGSSGYWEDSIPLSSLGSYITDINGNASFYDLDMMQFNIDYPYSYSPPENQIMLNTNTETNNSDVKIYATIQRFEDVGGINYSNYTNVKNLSNTKYIDFDDTTYNIDTTKYQVVDGTVMFPPRNQVDFKDAYITFHIEMKTNGVINNPLKIQRMSVASLAFDQSKLYGINSPTGNKFYPFTRQGGAYSTKIKNPFAIYKDTTPYLYLTGDSGICSMYYPELEFENTSNFSRGLSVAINPSKREDYYVYGLSLWMNYDYYAFAGRQKAFSIYSNYKTIIFYLEPEADGSRFGNKRAKLVAYDATSITGEEIDTTVKLYQNGTMVDPYVQPESWSFITVSFDEPMLFDESIGQFEVYPRILFNNTSFYLQSIENKVDDIFESHLGLSNVVAQDSSTLAINSDGLDLFTDVKWTTYIDKPV